MITKSKGAKDNCPSCGKELVCNEKDYQGKISLQWQNPEDGTAHFDFDFKTKKSSCKASVTGGQATAKSFTPDRISLAKISLDEKQVADIALSAYELAERMTVVLETVQRVCNNAGISHPATIGMIFNQVCETRRA